MYYRTLPSRLVVKSTPLIALLARLSNYQYNATVKGHKKNRAPFLRLVMKHFV
jgi:hypothetical protein